MSSVNRDQPKSTSIHPNEEHQYKIRHKKSESPGESFKRAHQDSLQMSLKHNEQLMGRY